MFVETITSLKIQSDPKNISRIEPFVEEISQKCPIKPEVYGHILISVTEAVNNAIIHGNKCDHSKFVNIVLKQTDQGAIAFIISDEGSGFNFGSLPDPTLPENILKLGGRGVFLMRQLADKVDFSDDGRTVQIYFNL